MSEENVQLVTGAYDDFNAGNVDAVLARFAPEIEWVEPGGGNSPSGTFTGPDSVANDVFSKVGETFEEFSVNVEDTKDEGDTVIVSSRFKGKSKSGVELDVPAEQVWKVSGGKITSMNNTPKDPDNWAAAWS